MQVTLAYQTHSQLSAELTCHYLPTCLSTCLLKLFFAPSCFCCWLWVFFFFEMINKDVEKQ